MTLRVGAQLVGIRADTDTTLGRLRRLLAAWIDDDDDVPWSFDVLLGPAHDRPTLARGLRPVPQIRLGSTLMARSRDPDDVLRALASILGGVLAAQDRTRSWSPMRAFAGSGRVVLVDVRPPALSADAVLTRAGIRELPTWAVSIEAATVHVPSPLGRLDWAAADADPPPPTGDVAELAGLAGLVADDTTVTDPSDVRRRGAGYADPSAGASMLVRFAARHPSTSWFSTVDSLVRDGRVTVSSDRSVVRRRIVEMIGR